MMMMRLDQRIDALRRLAILGIIQHDDPYLRITAEEILAYVATDEDVSLDDVLGLTPRRGEAHWRTIRSRTIRNIHLRIAAATFHPGLPPRQASQQIHAALVRYVNDGWLGDRSAFETPAHLRGRIEAHLWAALRAWPSILGERAIEAVLTGE